MSTINHKTLNIISSVVGVVMLTILLGSVVSRSKAATTLPGDINGDGKVDIFDLSILLSNFGKTQTGTPSVTPSGSTTPMVTPVATSPPTSRSCDFRNTTVNIMPLGDSITNGIYGNGATSDGKGGYRYPLWQKAAASGWKTKSVGSRTDTKVGVTPFDSLHGTHEGHNGYRIDMISDQIVAWQNTYQPDVVLLHIGTNDMNLNYSTATAPDRLAGLVDKILARPYTHLFLASIITSKNKDLNVKIAAYNTAVKALVDQKAAQGKHIHYVNINPALTTADLSDTLHPNDVGYSKMADVWYAALAPCYAR